MCINIVDDKEYGYLDLRGSFLIAVKSIAHSLQTQTLFTDHSTSGKLLNLLLCLIFLSKMETMKSSTFHIGYYAD